MIQSLKPEMTTIVERIESKPATTQAHYGDYLAAFSQLVPDSDRNTLAIVGYAMVNAGANEYGVKSALRIITGEI